MEKTPEVNGYNIEISLQGSRCCIGVGKGVILALGKPSHVSIMHADTLDSIRIFPCDENDDMSFRVPTKLFTDHRCVMRINSKKFVHGIMRCNELDISRTYVILGKYIPDQNAAVFSLKDDVTLRDLPVKKAKQELSRGFENEKHD